MTEHDDADDDSTRTVLSLSTGARVGLVLALVLLVAAGYLLWSPIQLYPPEGFPIKCGSGAVPPDNDLGTAACGSVNVIRQWQAGGLAAAAVLVGAGLHLRVRRASPSREPDRQRPREAVRRSRRIDRLTASAPGTPRVTACEPPGPAPDPAAPTRAKPRPG